MRLGLGGGMGLRGDFHGSSLRWHKQFSFLPPVIERGRGQPQGYCWLAECAMSPGDGGTGGKRAYIELTSPVQFT